MFAAPLLEGHMCQHLLQHLPWQITDRRTAALAGLAILSHLQRSVLELRANAMAFLAERVVNAVVDHDIVHADQYRAQRFVNSCHPVAICTYVRVV